MLYDMNPIGAPKRLSFFLINILLFASLLSCERDRVIEPAADCLVRASERNGQVIPGSYIITYRPVEIPVAPGGRLASPAASLLARHAIEGAVAETFSGPTNGFVAQLSESQARELATDPAVETVEPDRIVSLCSCVEVALPTTLTWNIQQTGFGRGDRQSEKTVWVLDTGIDLDHPDLNVDQSRSRSFVGNATLEAKEADDANGHGTHVAGIIGARNNNIGITGVASGAKLVALKVLDSEGEGKLSTLVLVVNHVSRNGRAGDVVNISIGGEGTSASLERAIRAAADKGILFSIAAGNDGKSTTEYSPANINHPNVLTVSAMDRNGNFAPFSNYGPDVDVCAYGVRIQSTYKDGRYASLSGTSMASPHVAGLLLIRGRNIPLNGFVQNDPDGQPDPIAKE